jgi:hypothetical protein
MPDAMRYYIIKVIADKLPATGAAFFDETALAFFHQLLIGTL